MFVDVGFDYVRCEYRRCRRTETAAAGLPGQCVNYGQRVQNSVFECLLDTAQSRLLQAKLRAIMDEEKDSLRFYYLGNRYQNKIEHFGCKPTYFPEDPLIL